MSRALETPGPERLAEMLSGPALAVGLDPRPVALSALAASVGLLGAPGWLVRAWQAKVSGGDVDPLESTRRLLEEQARCYGYLSGHLGPLTDWMEPGTALARRALAGAYAALAGVDLLACVEAPGIGGDLLGPVYSVLRSRAEKSGSGAFYTPASLCSLLAHQGEEYLYDGASVYEPACGSAGMAVAAVRAMRARGDHPETVRWVLQDIDATALALAGVNLASHGLPHVELVHGNALAPTSAA